MEMDAFWDSVRKYVVDFLSYVVSWVCLHMPHSCDEWTSFLGLLIGLFTFFGITLPKAWPNIQKVFKK